MENNYKKVRDIIARAFDNDMIIGDCLYISGTNSENLMLSVESMDAMYLIDEEIDRQETYGDILNASKNNIDNLVTVLTRVSREIKQEMAITAPTFSACPNCGCYEHERQNHENVVCCMDCLQVYRHQG